MLSLFLVYCIFLIKKKYSWTVQNQSHKTPNLDSGPSEEPRIAHWWKDNQVKSNTVNRTRPTWETAWMPADQPDWGGGGGKPTEAPENQLLLARGSAETMVISGRLKNKPQKYTWLQIIYLSLMTGVSFLVYIICQLCLHYLRSLVWSLWGVLAEGRRIMLMCHKFAFLEFLSNQKIIILKTFLHCFFTFMISLPLVQKCYNRFVKS